MSRSVANARVPELDSIRALAILSVLFWHWLHMEGVVGGKLHMLTRMTWSGVDLFFVLSGFLIGGILMQNRESTRYFQPFFARRLYRIMPLYLVVLLAAMILGSTLVTSRFPELQSAFTFRLPAWTFFLQIQNLAMAWVGQFAQQSLTVTWSLALEEQFYLILPGIIRWTPVAWIPRVCLAFILSAPIIRIALFHWAPERAGFWCYVSLPCRWDALFAGVLAAWLWRNDEWRDWLFLQKTKILGAFILGGGVIIWMTISARGVIMAPFMTQWGYTIVAAFYWLFLLTALLFRSSPYTGFLRWPPLLWVGVSSYGIYLLHEPIRTLVMLYGGNNSSPLIGFLLQSLILCGLVALSWRYLETPLLRIGQKHQYGRGTISSGSNAGD